ncbi:complex I subunit 1/NuoH family protein [Puniceicoccus vermicola]|uniref:NADH-quinone oxidoreductase subunit H n=1 Tax=Puniceicoccus vermicola TaxID=388746 RepID=A0A7X1E2S9_9BACT|nr:complex I subunit 1 family protein [Puniceicoccus vermicola]MBC2600770.1 NADH-quinone oxidoreductase subunit H [Puniceicoccus vermicola]
MELTSVLLKIVYAVLMIVVVMTMAGYSVLIERKVSSWVQGRVGPNRASPFFVKYLPVIGPMLVRWGIFQPVADGLKFLFKEEITPGHVNKVYYYMAPIIALVPALTTMVVIPFGQYTNPDTGAVNPLMLAPLDIGILFIFAVSSLGVYGIVLAGWSSNNKYSFLGSIRSSAQMISYELSLGLSIFPLFLWLNAPGVEGGLGLTSVVGYQQNIWFIFVQPLSALLFLVAIFAETNRLPFDMAESETDLVGGFHTEYGCFKFGIFFVAEYAHIVIGSALFALLFLGGWHFLPGVANPWPDGWIGGVLSTIWFIIKVVAMIVFFVLIRWTIPRFRYDQVMKLGWTILLPLAIANLILNAIIIAIIDTQ